MTRGLPELRASAARHLPRSRFYVDSRSCFWLKELITILAHDLRAGHSLALSDQVCGGPSSSLKLAAGVIRRESPAIFAAPSSVLVSSGTMSWKLHRSSARGRLVESRNSKAATCLSFQNCRSLDDSGGLSYLLLLLTYLAYFSTLPCSGRAKTKPSPTSGSAPHPLHFASHPLTTHVCSFPSLIQVLNGSDRAEHAKNGLTLVSQVVSSRSSTEMWLLTSLSQPQEQSEVLYQSSRLANLDRLSKSSQVSHHHPF